MRATGGWERVEEKLGFRVGAGSSGRGVESPAKVRWAAIAGRLEAPASHSLAN